MRIYIYCGKDFAVAAKLRRYLKRRREYSLRNLTVQLEGGKHNALTLNGYTTPAQNRHPVVQQPELARTAPRPVNQGTEQLRADPSQTVLKQCTPHAKTPGIAHLTVQCLEVKRSCPRQPFSELQNPRLRHPGNSGTMVKSIHCNNISPPQGALPTDIPCRSRNKSMPIYQQANRPC